MELAAFTQIMCLVFSEPSFHLSKRKESTVCNYAGLVYKESKKNNIDPTLLMALIYVESGWTRTIVSSAGACGLTQVLPKYTGKRNRIIKLKKHSCRDLKDPRKSIIIGAKILSWWVNKYGEGNVVTGLCGYSSGFRCKINSKRKRPLKQGISYANKVLRTKSKILFYMKKHKVSF